MALLEASGIGKNFGETHVLKDISLDLEQGEALAIIGSSGSGKTTLLRCLNFLERPDTGIIKVNGETMWDAADPATQKESEIRKKRLHFGLVFQDFNLYAASVAENVSMNLNSDLEKVRDALICARIPKAADQLDGIISKEFYADGIDFSGGERQRIALARVFYENHDILIMDEPTAAMDIRFEKEFYDLVFSYLKDKTILMISHRLASITACDRIFYMENGSITEQGTHQELMEKQGKYAKLFLAQLN